MHKTDKERDFSILMANPLFSAYNNF